MWIKGMGNEWIDFGKVNRISIHQINIGTRDKDKYGIYAGFSYDESASLKKTVSLKEAEKYVEGLLCRLDKND